MINELTNGVDEALAKATTTEEAHDAIIDHMTPQRIRLVNDDLSEEEIVVTQRRLLKAMDEKRTMINTDGYLCMAESDNTAKLAVWSGKYRIIHFQKA